MDIPADILSVLLKDKLEKTAEQLVLAKVALAGSQKLKFVDVANDKAKTGIMKPEVQKAERKKAKGFAKTAGEANTEAQKFAVTEAQAAQAQANPQAIILVKAVELAQAQVTAGAAKAKANMYITFLCLAEGAADAAWMALDDDEGDQNWLKDHLHIKRWSDETDETLQDNWDEVEVGQSVWFSEHPENKRKINDMQRTRNEYLEAVVLEKLAHQECDKAVGVVNKLESEAGQAVLDMVKAAVAKAEAK
jgi:hypothetical protein